MNKYYSVSYQDGIWLNAIYGDKAKAEAFQKECHKDGMKANLNEREIKGGYFTSCRLGEASAYTSFEYSDFINLGDLKDVKGSYASTAFCLPQYKEEGKKAFEEEQQKRAKRSDSYYSRPWV